MVKVQSQECVVVIEFNQPYKTLHVHFVFSYFEIARNICTKPRVVVTCHGSLNEKYLNNITFVTKSYVYVDR